MTPEQSILLLLALAFGLGGWILHLYTLILSYYSDPKWKISISFNYYHEAKIELIVFTAVIIITIIAIISLFL